MEKEVTCIRLDKELKKKVRDLAESESRTISNQITYILKKYFKNETQK